MSEAVEQILDRLAKETEGRILAEQKLAQLTAIANRECEAELARFKILFSDQHAAVCRLHLAATRYVHYTGAKKTEARVEIIDAMKKLEPFI